MSAENPITLLLQRLAVAGYEESYVRRVAFPDWWEDEIALNPAGYQQAIMLISRNMRLDSRSLLEEHAEIRSREFNTFKNKAETGYREE